MKYLITSLLFVFLIVSCGGDDEIDPNATTTFTKKHNKVNWEYFDGDDTANLWFTNNNMHWYSPSDDTTLLDKECWKFPINGSVTDPDFLYEMEVETFILFPLVNKEDSLMLQIKYNYEDDTDIYEEYWIFTVLGNTLRFNWAENVNGSNSEFVDSYHKTSSDLPNCN